MINIRENTTIFTPHLVIFVTVTRRPRVCAYLGHSACALTTVRWCSASIIHLSGVTWHPLAHVCHHRMMTLILDKLFIVWGDFSDTNQLRQNRSGGMNVTYVIAETFHACSGFTVVTDDCHANSILVTHVTVYCKWYKRTLVIWVNDVISACTVGVFPYHRTRSYFNWNVDFNFGFCCC